VVHGEQQWTKYRPLWNANVELNGVRLLSAHLHKLRSATEVETEPAERYVGHSELSLQPFNQQRAINGVKCGGQI